MSGETITLGGQNYRIGPFTLGDVQDLIPMVIAAGLGMPASLAASAAMSTLIHKAVQKYAPDLTFDSFRALENVTLGELLQAKTKIGQAIGYLAKDGPEKKDETKPADPAASP